MTFDQGQSMTLTFDILIDSFTHLVNRISQLWYHRLQQFLKNPLFYLFPIQKHKGKIWSCRNISQGELRVIIWTSLIVLEHSMLHTSFHEHRPFGFGEEDFLRLLTYMGHLGLVTWTISTNFRSPIQWRLHMKFDLDWPSGFWGEHV